MDTKISLRRVGQLFLWTILAIASAVATCAVDCNGDVGGTISLLEQGKYLSGGSRMMGLLLLNGMWFYGVFRFSKNAHEGLSEPPNEARLTAAYARRDGSLFGFALTILLIMATFDFTYFAFDIRKQSGVERIDGIATAFFFNGTAVVFLCVFRKLSLALILILALVVLMWRFPQLFH